MIDTAMEKVKGFPARRDVVLANRVNQDLGLVGLIFVLLAMASGNMPKSRYSRRVVLLQVELLRVNSPFAQWD
jgi:hypothetical protein